MEREEAGSEGKAREWLEKAGDAPPDPRWICGPCGYAAPEWQALCRHCGQFNSLAWITPSLDVHQPQKRVVGLEGGFISPPQTR